MITEYFKIAVRNLRSRSLRSWLTILGIVIGVSVLIFLNALIGGLQDDLLNQTVGNSPHLTATVKERAPPTGLPDRQEGSADRVLREEVSPRQDSRPLQNWAPLQEALNREGAYTAVSPVVNGSGFAAVGGTSSSIVIKGVDLEAADDIYNISGRMVDGDFQAGRSQVLMGHELAEELRVAPGGMARISTAEGKELNVTVSGTFDLGSSAINSSWVFLSLTGGQTLLDFDGGISGLELQVDDVFQAQQEARELSMRYPELSWSSWQEENTDLLSALNSQSASSYLIQAFVLLAVAMGISSVLAVSVIQKSRQIGILKALGITTNRVSRVFLMQGAVLGLIGAALGSAMGAGLITLFFTLVRDDQGEALFPIQLEPWLFIFAVMVSTIAGMAAAWVPARRAAQLDPLEVIKNG